MTNLAIKCLTIRQPWATLIIKGVKQVEGRDWETKHRGLLWIHSAKCEPSKSNLDLAQTFYPGAVPENLPLGKILGCVQLVDVISREAYEAEYNKTDCLYLKAWLCQSPRSLLEPINFSGKLGVYTLPAPIRQIVSTATLDDVTKVAYIRKSKMNESEPWNSQSVWEDSLHGLRINASIMFRNTFQKGFLSIFYSIGSNPLLIWKTQTKNGHIKRVTDEDLNSVALEIIGSNVATAYIVTPIHPRESLAIKLPFIVLIVKNMNKSFSFEVQILDDQNVLRRFRVSNCHNSTKINSFSTAMPIALSDGWNQIQFNLADFTRRAYNTAYVETVRVQIHANIRVRRIFFSDRIYTDEEKPEQYRLFLPKERVAKKSEITNKPPTTPKTERNDYCVDTCNAPCAVINPS